MNYMIKAYILLSIICASINADTYSTIKYIEPMYMDNIKKSLVKIGKVTSTHTGYQKPNISLLKEERNAILFAKIDFEGVDRYFIFENEDDIHELVNTLQVGHSRGISWYYLKDHRKHSIIAQIIKANTL